MDSFDLVSLLTQYWIVPVLVVGVPVLGKVIVALWTTWGAEDEKKPEILRAVGDMFRPLRRGGASDGGKGGVGVS
ncbi:hypothetical protein [Plantactinospora sonchi]|uniref:Uncharacterized protein n=1 Tax=Plantactinospora sonchi TaxID=1544735 RepID=A0ABU7RWS7_9ACTN